MELQGIFAQKNRLVEIIAERQSGKTTFAIDIAQITGYPIVVATKEQAEKLQLDYPHLTFFAENELTPSISKFMIWDDTKTVPRKGIYIRSRI